MRWTVVALMAALGMAFSMGMAGSAEAAKASKAPKAKQCQAADLTGKKVTFRCGADEKCCWQPIIQQGSCVPASGVCL
jgi:Cu/Ag efflux protein CusF